ncbi:MAG: SHOCT domain-containing protein [Solirubrobacterales bacterium]
MPTIGRRPLLRATMLGAAVARCSSERTEALVKLKGLRDAGVLTGQQFEAERRRLLTEA